MTSESEQIIPDESKTPSQQLSSALDVFQEKFSSYQTDATAKVEKQSLADKAIEKANEAEQSRKSSAASVKAASLSLKNAIDEVMGEILD